MTTSEQIRTAVTVVADPDIVGVMHHAAWGRWVGPFLGKVEDDIRTQIGPGFDEYPRMAYELCLDESQSQRIKTHIAGLKFPQSLEEANPRLRAMCISEGSLLLNYVRDQRRSDLDISATYVLNANTRIAQSFGRQFGPAVLLRWRQYVDTPYHLLDRSAEDKDIAEGYDLLQMFGRIPSPVGV